MDWLRHDVRRRPARHHWALALAAVTLPYWPGAPSTLTDSAPVYGQAIQVIDTLGVKDIKAVREWNACGSVQLMRGPLSLAESPGTITILPGLDEWPRGGWAGDHGVVYLPLGAWERSLGTIRHEVGHALGFGHTKRWSSMGGSNHVQPVDCEGLVDYYGR